MRKKIKIKLNKQVLSLRDLLSIKEWQKIQDDFSEVTNINLRTVDADCRALTMPSKQPRLCTELLKSSLQKDKFCGPCLPTFLGGKWTVDKNLSFVCGVGLCNFAAPIKTGNGKAWGYILAGPVLLVKRKPKEEYSSLAEELNIDLEDLWSALLEIEVVSFHGIQSTLELIQDVGVYTIEAAYRNLMREREVTMAFDSFKLKRLLDALLDVAFEITNADIGSIMFLDRKKEALTIHTSKGITDEVVRNTRVRLGDGISGIAARDGESFLIDDNIQDNRIRPYLNRPQISSSMVLPLKIENRIMGVMNLGALKTSAVRFSRDNLSVMHRLIDLASLAL